MYKIQKMLIFLVVILLPLTGFSQDKNEFIHQFKLKDYTVTFNAVNASESCKNIKFDDQKEELSATCKCDDGKSANSTIGYGKLLICASQSGANTCWVHNSNGSLAAFSAAGVVSSVGKKGECK